MIKIFLTTIRSGLTAGIVWIFMSNAYADLGVSVDNLVRFNSGFLHGISGPLSTSAVSPPGYVRSGSDTAASLVKLASSLSASYLTRNAANRSDMMTFWPVGANPTHLITCIEVGSNVSTSDGRKNPSVQSIGLSSGNVTTILRGMSNCDGIRTTPWGTILATEETSDGSVYEIIDPLGTIEHIVTNRATGTIVQANGSTAAVNIAKRTALPVMTWEGLTVLSTGVVIAVDELRPGDWDLNGNNSTDPDADGGAIYKFIPASPHSGGNITSLSQSPLVAGNTYAMRINCHEESHANFTVSYGQGCESGNGGWVSVNASTARKDAHNNGATGFYRPEDLHFDPVYTGVGIRFCWANTGNEAAGNYGEVMCGVDSAPLTANATKATVTVHRFIEGNTDFNSMDNLAFHPSGLLFVLEDHTNGDVWSCLPDGADLDFKSDGCVKVISVVDSSAEPSGFIFSPDGSTAYISIQHSADPADGTLTNDKFATDDILKITGFTSPVTTSSLQSQLNLGAGTASVIGTDIIQLKDLSFGGVILSVNIRINMDGTWTLQ